MDRTAIDTLLSKARVHNVLTQRLTTKSNPIRQVRNFTREELARHDGIVEKTVYVGVRGVIYDVSSSDFYKPKKGPYHAFAGRDASRALGMGVVDEKECHDDISGLSEDEIFALDDWVGLFSSKYNAVGVLPSSRARLADANVQDQQNNVTLRVFEFNPDDKSTKKKKKGSILCVHGFPDNWFGYRHQIQPLIDDGWQVIVPDQRGYGRSSCPKDAKEYSMDKLVEDNVVVLDYFGIDRVVLLGHDWGGMLVFNFCQARPERVRAVASVCTPWYAVPKTDPWIKMQAEPGRFEYQVYFNRDASVAELDRDIERTLRFFMRSASQSDREGLAFTGKEWSIDKRGGLMVGFPERIPLSQMLTQAEMDYYVQEFKVSGFAGGLRWYRNVTANYIFMRDKFKITTITVPALMVCAEHDMVLPPSMTKGMEKNVINMEKVVLDAGHFAHQEQPAEFNKAMLRWLNGINNTKAKM